MFAHYVLIGGLATAIQYILLLVLVEWVYLPADAAAVVSNLVGAALVYLGNHQWTFQSRQALHSRALPRFFLVALLAAALNGLIVSLGTRVLDLHYFLAQTVATLSLLCLTYRLNRSWTFI